MNTVTQIDVFKEIKDRVPITEAFKFYGIQVNRSNKALCIFHKEKTPSLTVFPITNSFYCFGCGFGGSVIDLVQKIYGLQPLDSAKKLDNDFGLSLFENSFTKTEKTKYHEMQRERNKQAKIEDDYKKWEKEYFEYLAKNIDLYQKLIEVTCPSETDEQFSDDFKTAINTKHILDYQWEILFNGSTEDKIKLYLAVNKVVELF